MKQLIGAIVNYIICVTSMLVYTEGIYSFISWFFSVIAAFILANKLKEFADKREEIVNEDES